MPHSWLLCAEPELDKHYYITKIRTILYTAQFIKFLPWQWHYNKPKHIRRVSYSCTLLLKKPRKCTQTDTTHTHKLKRRERQQQINKMKWNTHEKKATENRYIIFTPRKCYARVFGCFLHCFIFKKKNFFFLVPDLFNVVIICLCCLSLCCCCCCCFLCIL